MLYEWFLFVDIINRINMKQTLPCMLANLKIIWQFHTHTVHQKCRDFLGRDISGPGLLFLVSSNRVVIPNEISKVNFREETTILVSMSEEI